METCIGFLSSQWRVNVDFAGAHLGVEATLLPHIQLGPG